MALWERFFNLRKYERMIADLAQLHDGIHEYSSSTATLHTSIWNISWKQLAMLLHTVIFYSNIKWMNNC